MDCRPVTVLPDWCSGRQEVRAVSWSLCSAPLPASIAVRRAGWCADGGRFATYVLRGRMAHRGADGP
jgi:hypothetical protein